MDREGETSEVRYPGALRMKGLWVRGENGKILKQGSSGRVYFGSGTNRTCSWTDVESKAKSRIQIQVSSLEPFISFSNSELFSFAFLPLDPFHRCTFTESRALYLL